MFPGLWGNLKLRVNMHHGVRMEKLQDLLDEFSFRHFYGTDGTVFGVLVDICKSQLQPARSTMGDDEPSTSTSVTPAEKLTH